MSPYWQIAIVAAVFIVGAVFGRFIFKKPTYGTIKIDTTREDKDVWLFELSVSPETLKKSKYALLKIDTSSHLMEWQ